MKKAYILFIMFLAVPTMCRAAEDGRLFISCSNIKSDNTVDCSITGSTSSKITSIDAEFSLSDNLSVVSFTPADKWEGNDVSNNKITVFNEDDVTGDFAIGTLKIKIKDGTKDTSESVSFETAEFSDDVGNEYEADTDFSIIDTTEKEESSGGNETVDNDDKSNENGSSNGGKTSNDGNSSTSKNDKTNAEASTNLNTGSFKQVISVIVCVVSLGFISFYYFKSRKNNLAE